MSTPRCPTCKNPYWRFRADWPPPGYCSVKCWQDRSRRRRKQPHETTAAVIEAYKEHRLNAHGTRDLVSWIDCDVCERYEERYAVSLCL